MSGREPEEEREMPRVRETKQGETRITQARVPVPPSIGGAHGVFSFTKEVGNGSPASIMWPPFTYTKKNTLSRHPEVQLLT